ncbi:MAG TPA: erythromycin esterase family protein [Myxococcales bacterium]
MANPEEILIDAIAETARPMAGSVNDFDPILEVAGNARVVLIGEASHGTDEFYERRAELTKRLIVEKGFRGVAAEADFPDAWRVNRFVRGTGNDAEAVEALSDFKRFPSWMWRNADVLDFVGWLREHNDRIGDPSARVGFYGLDLYSLHTSIAAVLDYLDKVDPEAVKRARYRYACFEHFGEDPQTYGYATSFGLSPDCEREVVNQLVEMQRRREELAARGGGDDEELFAAEQNARVVKDAEEYYRSMFEGRVSSWNLRDTHMAETLDALLAHLDRKGGRSKMVVWAHNSHVGDARATQMGEAGEINIGQLARDRYPGQALLVGFSTYTGTVTAASEWGAPAERKRVRPALRDSYEALFHRTGAPSFLLNLRDLGEAGGGLREPRLERAIGVIYLPQTERVSHYFQSRLPSQFDVLMHFDETRAVEPLERTAGWVRGELPETYPTGM